MMSYINDTYTSFLNMCLLHVHHHASTFIGACMGTYSPIHKGLAGELHPPDASHNDPLDIA